MRRTTLYILAGAVFTAFVACWIGLSVASQHTAPEGVGARNDIGLSIIASDGRYAVSVPRGTSVYGALGILASTTSFAFKAEYYPGLGYFVREMQGIANAGGAYWTLYINGAYSTSGASQYVPKDGDVVEWRYEKL